MRTTGSGDRSIHRSRRAILVAGATLSLAGCLDALASDDPDEDSDDADDPDGIEVNGVTLDPTTPIIFRDPETDQILADFHYHRDEGWGHWHRVPIELGAGESRSIDIEVFDPDGETISVGEADPIRIELREGEDTPADLLTADITGDRLTIHGHSQGEGELVLDLVRTDDDQVGWTPPPVAVEIQ